MAFSKDTIAYPVCSCKIPFLQNNESYKQPDFNHVPLAYAHKIKLAENSIFQKCETPPVYLTPAGFFLGKPIGFGLSGGYYFPVPFLALPPCNIVWPILSRLVAKYCSLCGLDCISSGTVSTISSP